MANSFKSLLTKSAQNSQLKTKYYGIVKGYFKNFKGIMSERNAREKVDKDEYMAELARRIGAHLLRKLKKNLRKHLRIQLDALGSQSHSEDVPDTSPPLSENLSVGEHHVRVYPQLRQLVREEKKSLSSKPQKFFDLLVIYHVNLIGAINSTLNNLQGE